MKSLPITRTGRIATVLVLCAALGACASNPQTSDSSSAPIERVPVEDISTDLDATGETLAESPRDRRSDAAATLLASAHDARAANDHANAVVLLERAIRLAPRNSLLWTELAGAHLAEGNLAVATQHARKAIALAGDDAGLQRSAWLALADIKAAQGETAEAQSIRQRYGRVRG